jgi:hypothetical protein
MMERKSLSIQQKPRTEWWDYRTWQTNKAGLECVWQRDEPTDSSSSFCSHSSTNYQNPFQFLVISWCKTCNVIELQHEVEVSVWEVGEERGIRGGWEEAGGGDTKPSEQGFIWGGTVKDEVYWYNTELQAGVWWVIWVEGGECDRTRCEKLCQKKNVRSSLRNRRRSCVLKWKSGIYRIDGVI